MNLDPLAIVSNLRAWVVGFAVWLAVDQAAGWRASEASPGGGARGMGAFFALFLVVRMVRILWPMRTAGAHSSKLVAGGRTLALHTFTGRTSDVATTTLTTTNTHGSVWNVGSTISGNIQTDTHTSRRQEFFLTSDDGVARGFQLRHDQLLLGQNQRVTAVWAIAPLRRHGRHVAFVNHTQRRTLFPNTELAVLAMGGSPALATLWAFLTLGFFLAGGSGSGIELGFAGLVFLIVVSRLQAGYFKHIGSRALVGRLTRDYSGVTPTPTGTLATPPPAPLPAPAPASLPAPPAAPVAPASWLPDPHGRHELRWWDGRRWTQDVSDAGSASSEP